MDITTVLGRGASLITAVDYGDPPVLAHGSLWFWRGGLHSWPGTTYIYHLKKKKNSSVNHRWTAFSATILENDDPFPISSPYSVYRPGSHF